MSQSIAIVLAVETAVALAAPDTPHITGSSDAIGNWDGRGKPLERVGDCAWEGRLDLRPGEVLEFKVTRGSWDTEAVGPRGERLPNHRLELAPDGRAWNLDGVPVDGPAHLRVDAWKDDASSAPSATPRERQIVGSYVVWDRFPSKHLGGTREVIVWLPPGYDGFGEKARLPVLYLHDGRQVFDPSTSTWGKDWQVDDIAQDLVARGEIEPFIAVAADCSDRREYEYSPGPGGDAYIRFLVDELKPAVDAAFRTDPARAYVAGSSMGGLAAFLEAWTHPDVFSGAACLSPAFIRSWGDTCKNAVDAAGRTGALPPVRWFLSCGGHDDIEKKLLPATLSMAEHLRAAGVPDDRLCVRIESWADHNEEAWARQVPHLLRYFFARPAP